MNTEQQKIEAKNSFLILTSQFIGIIVALILIFVGFAFYLGGIGAFLGLAVLVASMIYPLVMLTRVSTEINIMCKDDGEHLMPYFCACLLGAVTFGIYHIYYLYRMQTRLYENAQRYNVQISEKGGSIILWYLLLLLLFGIGPIVSLAIILKNFNKMANKYNESLPVSIGGSPSGGSVIKKKTAARHGVLRCIKGEIAGAEIKMSESNPVIIIGRDPNMANLVTADKRISKQHCIVRYDAAENTFYITDCNSTNGTYLSNSVRLTSGVETKVSNGEQIKLSDHTAFTVRIQD